MNPGNPECVLILILCSLNVTLKKRAQKAAIEAIEQALYDRGQGHLLVGQPLKLVSTTGSTSMTVKMNESSRHDPSPAMLPSKRMSSPGTVPENSSKKQKQSDFSGCPVCLGPHHPLKKCPVTHQDTQRFVCSRTRLIYFLI